MAARQYFQSALAANPSYGPAAQSLAEIGVGGPKTSDGFRRGTDGEGAVSRRNVRPANREPPEKASSDKVSPDKVSPNKVSQVQLGAFQSEAQALQAWEKIAAAAQGALNGQKPLAVAVDIPGKGRLWRLRTAVASQSAALALCHALAQHGQVCVPARN